MSCFKRPLQAQGVVAYLGPQGTYCETAMQQRFGLMVRTLSCDTVDAACQALVARQAQYAVLPLENSTEGVVTRTLDVLYDFPFPIIGEIVLPIHHCLLTKSGSLHDVTRICGHQQALAQCRRWLSLHGRGISLEAVASAGVAARLAATEPDHAAVAGAQAAQHYGLRAVVEGIEDEADNRTRFAVLGGAGPAATGFDCTTVIVSLANVPGALVDVLTPFARHGVSVLRLASRPAHGSGWNYRFYLDLMGHRDDPPLSAALTEIRHSMREIRMLGSYPRAA
ncbi:P-protein (Includes: Chorismate mutase; Prephenate dehydratase) (fragment) [Paraburkholderia ribeironis]|uniref:prephenate dehydratase n=1 Tax=Paraburkholderia ribeironis TaxID=1247936 RepID=A0A1N7RY96_9BURK